MSVKQSDNVNPYHPKPIVDTERKFVNGVYIDYEDIAEVIAAVPIQFRANKRFWVNGVELFSPDGTNFISPTFRNMSEDFQIINPI